MRKLRATDLPFNKRVIIPAALKEEDEMNLQHLKSKMISTVNEYVKDEATSSNKWSNLTSTERKGLRTLKEKCNDNDIVIYQTDKSGRFAVDTPQNYIKACEPHVTKDATITAKEYEDLEVRMNAHSIMWTRMLAAGKETNHTSRIKSNMVTSNCPLAPLYTLRKDHKRVDDPTIGPPVRPVCGAVQSYNQHLSHLMS